MNQYWRLSGLIHSGSLSERLIVSLDHGNCREALEMVDRLSPAVRFYRIGKQLYSYGGPDLVRQIRSRNCEVFLDLKFHDTSRAAGRAAAEATRLGVKMFDLHAQGSCEVMNRVRHEVNKLCLTEGLRRPHLLAVAVMSGLAKANEGARQPDASARVVVRLAKTASDAAFDGVVTSPQMVSAIRNYCGRRFIIVTAVADLESKSCGVLADRAPLNMHNVALGPADAICAGADYLVAGSPVWNADEPARAVRTIVQEMERGLRMGQRSALGIFSERTIQD